MQRTILITLAAALFIAPQAVQAQEPATVRVEIGDIDASSNAGADRLLRRLRHAVDQVCDVQTGLHTRRQLREASQCRRETMQQAVAQLDNPVVTARYQGRNNAVLASNR